MQYRINITTTQNNIRFTSEMSALDILNLINMGSIINYFDDETEEVNLFVCHLQLVSITDRVFKSVNENDESLIKTDGFDIKAEQEVPYDSVVMQDTNGNEFTMYLEK